MSCPRCPEHSTYRAGCEPCRRYGRWYYNIRELRRAQTGPLLLDVTGTQRRLRALYRIGWDWRLIGARIGMDNRNVSRLATLHAGVTARNAAKVAAVYDALSMTPGPSLRAKLHAERRGWPPPLAWDDDTIDDPDAQPQGVGYVPPQTDDERVADLTAQGLPASVIAQMLGCSTRAVTRSRARARRTGVAA